MENMTLEEAAYRLVVMLGEIKNEMERGDAEPVTKDEVDNFYDIASFIYNEVEGLER